MANSVKYASGAFCPQAPVRPAYCKRECFCRVILAWVLACCASQTAGLDMQQGVVGDMKALGVREAYKSKLQARVGRRVAWRTLC